MSSEPVKKEFLEKLVLNILKIREEGASLNLSVKVTTTASDDLFILTRDNQVGLAGCCKSNGDLIYYKINVNKYIWAEREGFARDEILSKLISEVLIWTDLESLKKHLFHTDDIINK